MQYVYSVCIAFMLNVFDNTNLFATVYMVVEIGKVPIYHCSFIVNYYIQIFKSNHFQEKEKCDNYKKWNKSQKFCSW